MRNTLLFFPTPLSTKCSYTSNFWATTLGHESHFVPGLRVFTCPTVIFNFLAPLVFRTWRGKCRCLKLSGDDVSRQEAVVVLVPSKENHKYQLKKLPWDPISEHLKYPVMITICSSYRSSSVIGGDCFYWKPPVCLWSQAPESASRISLISTSSVWELDL
jgi:hypothetical protein